MAGKKITKAREGIDRNKLYKLDEAIKMVKARASAKFDETVEIAINLGVDPRHEVAGLLDAGVVLQLAGGVLEAQVEQRLLGVGQGLQEPGIVDVVEGLRPGSHQKPSSRVTNLALMGSFWMARSMATRASSGSG